MSLRNGIIGRNRDLLALLARLWRHLGAPRRRALALLLVLMFVSAAADVVSLGAVLPFLAVLVAPETAFQYEAVARVAATLHIASAAELVLPLTIAFALAAVGAGAVRLLVLWLSARLSFTTGVDLGLDMYRRVLYQPYRVHVARNSSEVVSAITYDASVVVTCVMLPVLVLASSAVTFAVVVVALVAIDPLMAAISAAAFGVSYAVISAFCRRRLERNAAAIAVEHAQLTKTIHEALGGIRDVLLDGAQELYGGLYHRPDMALRRAQANTSFLAASPRFVIEALGLVFIAVLAYAASTQKGGLGAALPTLGALAMGAMRLIPALQQGFSAWANVVGNSASLTRTVELLDQPLPAAAREPAPAPLLLQASIRFERVGYRYSSEGPAVLDDISLSIRKGERVGFVGVTGSGKSTLLDLLMGLLEPDSGRVLVDEQPLAGARLRAWQRNIAHVPQSVYLSDATVAENIGFGIPLRRIDLERVAAAVRQAQLSEVIDGNPAGYLARVGERGVRLSAGQRQRIGIARALYKAAAVLVFDEATSALDATTERAVMDAIERLDRELTVILVAHRLATVRHCDRIFELRDGRLVAEGTYEQLLRESQSFRTMVAHATL